MREILHKILIGVSLVFSGAILISYSASYIHPGKFWPIAFAGLAYPYLLAINFLFVVYWLFRRRWSFLIPLLSILIGYQHLSGFFQLNRSEEPSANGNNFQILTYNVRSFDRYLWTKNPETPKNIIKLVKETQVGIICFQEFRTTKSGLLSLNNLKNETGAKNVFISSKSNGVAIFSKYPILKRGEISFEKGNLCSAIFADLKIGKDTVRIYNLHLESNRFIGKNYDFINKKDYKGDEQELEEIKDISFRLRFAFIRRAKQADIVSAHISKSPYKNIVCGDFNDTPNSYVYHTLKGNLTDSFREKGRGISTTYSGDFPSFRIDFILHDEFVKCNSYRRIKKRYSDHFPVLTNFSLIE